MKTLIYTIIICITCCNTKEKSDLGNPTDLDSVKVVDSLNYNLQVYKLINCVYEQKVPEHQIRTSYISPNHNLRSSNDFLETDLFRRLISKEFKLGNNISDKQLIEYKDSWRQDEIDMPEKFDSTKIDLPYLKLKDPKTVDINNHEIISSIDYVLFHNDLAISVGNVYGIVTTAFLSKWDGKCYVSQGSVSYPRSAEE
ncbi:hypothetical protein AAU57_02070 [Nonlabens sp. YIK11]|uniref:hypothetical protein n=1 Tax=Nonlabens sp. YIK11 TaxID=1453349 RepID=UPI0006DC9995|nr:hypothetical protein [Nonlabens sp. YIK11]KQC32244.1 hypothetical protein AAU57_02070 [Nonlabens sp. YIK11]